MRLSRLLITSCYCLLLPLDYVDFDLPKAASLIHFIDILHVTPLPPSHAQSPHSRARRQCPCIVSPSSEEIAKHSILLDPHLTFIAVAINTTKPRRLAIPLTATACLPASHGKDQSRALERRSSSQRKSR